MTRIAFTADLHVDDYFGRVDPETGLNRRFLDMLETTAWIGRKARELECEALVVAGDYVEAKPNPRSGRVTRIARALEAGPDRQVHVRGNHDGVLGELSIADDLADRRPSWSGYTTPGFELVGDVAVCVIPHLDRRWIRALAGFEATPESDVNHQLEQQYLTIARGLYAQAKKAGARAAILVGHQLLDGNVQMGDHQAPSFLRGVDLWISAHDLAAIGFAAVTFGHVHRPQVVLAPTSTSSEVVFVGSPERVDFAEESEHKSFLVVDVDAGGRATLERIPTPARRFLTITGDGSFDEAAVEDSVIRAVDLDPDVDLADLRRALNAAGAFWIQETRHRSAEAAAPVGGMAEDLSPEAALAEYFAGDPDAEELVALGREILAEVA